MRIGIQGGLGKPRTDRTGTRVGRYIVIGPGKRKAQFTWAVRCVVCGAEKDIASRHMARIDNARTDCWRARCEGSWPAS